MTRGLLFGLLMGTLVAVVVLAIVALKLERDRNYMHIVETPPQVVETVATRAPTHRGSASPVAGGSLQSVVQTDLTRLAAVPEPQPLPQVAPPMSADRLLRATVAPEAPQLVQTGPLVQLEPMDPTAPQEPAPRPDRTAVPSMSEPPIEARPSLPPMRPTVQPPMPPMALDPTTLPVSPLDQFGEALGLGTADWDPSGPVLDLVLPPTQFVDDTAPALPALAKPSVRQPSPKIAWTAPDGPQAPSKQSPPRLAFSSGAAPSRSPLLRLTDPLQPTWPVPTARPPSVADILASGPGPRSEPPQVPGPLMAIVWIADDRAEAATGEALPVLARTDRGALIRLARDLAGQAASGPILVTTSPAASARTDLAALSQFAGVLVAGPARDLLADGSMGAVPVYPARTTTDLTRAAIHAERDGAVIVALPDTPETRAAVADWWSTPASATVTQVSAASALARVSTR